MRNYGEENTALVALNSEKPVQYGHVTIGNTQGIGTQSQYTVHTVINKI